MSGSTLRWRPVAPINQVKGLLDDEGFMWRDVEGVVKHASPEEVEIEIRAQIERARQFGMKPTHVDHIWARSSRISASSTPTSAWPRMLASSR